MEANEYIVHLKQFNLITAEEFTKVVRAFGVKARDGKLSHSITENLQSFDIITQRLQHLIDTHEKVMTLYIDDIFKESFLHLQYFQFSVISFDLFRVLSFIDLNSSDLSLPSESHSHNDESANSKNRSRFTSLSETIKSSLRENAGESRFLKMPALTKRQISICRQLYTMECERIVLDWFVTNSTAGLSDLLEVYQSWSLNYKDPSIELFDNV